MLPLYVISRRRARRDAFLGAGFSQRFLRVFAYRRPGTAALILHLTNKPSISGEFDMLETIAIILVVLWALGMVSSYTMGGFVHILLVFAIVVILIRVIQGRRI